MNTEANISKRIGVCDTQPITIEGLRSILAARQDLELTGSRTTLAAAVELLANDQPDVLILDKSFGIQLLLEWLNSHRILRPFPATIVWGNSLSEAEALRFLQAGARGIVRKTADLASIVACIQAVSAGNTWMEESVFGQAARHDRSTRSELTTREQQVLQLVEQGMKNKEIGRELGIRPGTVKIHLKHIFEKTGVRGRYGLALNVLKDRGPVAASDAATLPPAGSLLEAAHP